MRPHLPVRRLFVEYLENRSVLAGNVLAQMVDSTLFISGDEFDNNVVIGGVGDEVTVQGIQTTINGNAGPATFAGVARIEVVGDDGDDLVQAFLSDALGEASSLGELHIDTGAGLDGVLVVWNSGSNVVINTGDGADVASVRSYGDHGNGDLQIATGDGADTVWLDLSYHTEGSILVDAGNGNDAVEVLFQLYESGGNLSLFMGNGNDMVTLHTSGNDIGMDLTIDGGRGVDALYGNPNRLTGDVDILDIEF